MYKANSHMPSQHNFAKVPEAEIQRSSFDRSHGYKTTFDAGYLIPIYADEALPGDTFNLKMTAFARMATPIKPVMDNLFLDTFFFAIPIRLLWTNWEKFNGAQTNPGDSTSYTVPQMTGPSGNGILSNTLSDYLGLPVGKASITFNSLWHRGYNLCWNTYFRDQNLQNSVTVDTGDGPDTYSNYVLLRRGKRHDYFTSCLPWTQKGTAVSIPLSGNAPVKGIGHVGGGFGTGSVTVLESGLTYPASTTYSAFAKPDWSTSVDQWYIRGEGNPGEPLIYADMSAVSSATINSLRQAFQLQRLYERDARGGTRYIEILKAHFGVTSPDFRLQRPEYLGGGSTPININPVAQTTPTPASGTTTPQGNLSGFGTCVVNNNGFTKSFVEHCIILGLANVRADLTYQQGMDRMFSRRTRFDFYWPALAHLGEQSVLNKEIYCNGDANDDLVFGYQERFAEYRYKPSKITGTFRSYPASGTTTIDYWHLAQAFGSLPTLNTTFIQDTPPMSRVLAVNTEPHFLFDAYFDLKCARPMPVYGVPGLIDHF